MTRSAAGDSDCSVTRTERQDRFEIDAEPREERAAPQSFLQPDQRAQIDGTRHAAIFRPRMRSRNR